MLEKLKEVLANYSEVSSDEITLETGLRSDLGLNSYELVVFASAIETEFCVSLSDRDVMSFQTIGDIVEYLEECKV